MKIFRFISINQSTTLCRNSKPIFSVNLPKCSCYTKELRSNILGYMSQSRSFSSRFNRQIIKQHLGSRRFIYLFPISCTCVLAYTIYRYREKLLQETLRIYEILNESLKKLVAKEKEQFPLDETKELSTSPIESTMSLDEIAQKALNSVVRIEAIKCQLMSLFTLVLSERLGFVYRHSGIVVTDSSIQNKGSPKDFRVTFNDGRSFSGSVPLAGNLRVQGDLCPIELKGTYNLSPLKLSPKKDNLEGRDVILYRINRSNASSLDNLGITPDRTEMMPYHHQEEKKKTDTVVSGGRLDLEILQRLVEKLNMETLWRVKVSNLDDSILGSPVIDQSGNVIGVVKRLITDGAVVSSLNTTRDFLTKFCSSSLSFSVVDKVGLLFLNLNPIVVRELKRLNKDSQLEQLNFVRHGHLVHTVIKGSLGHKFGIKPGDVITHVNNQPVVAQNDVHMKLISDRQATLRVQRGQAVQDIILKV